MNQVKTSHFDQAAATWDDNPMRIALMRAVGEAILREARPTKKMDVLDYTPDMAISVHHHGFDRNELKARLSDIGFRDTRDLTAYTLRKPGERGGDRDFPIFLVIAKKPPL
jgi:hypothetical protein